MKRILDFGCGKGYRAEVLAKRGEYWGIDIDPQNIALAKKDYPAGHFTTAEPDLLPFDDSSFDEIYAFDVLEHVNYFEKTIAEICRCLRSGGRFVAEVPFAESEKILNMFYPNYLKDAGHKRIIINKDMVRTAHQYGFKLAKKARKKGIDNLFLVFMFMTGHRIIRQTGDLQAENLILQRVAYLFSEDFFSTRFFRKIRWFWFICPIWLLSQPIGRLLSWILPKTIRYEFVLNK